MTLRRDRLPDPLSYFEGQGLKLSSVGKWRTAACPFHGGSDSLRINTESGGWCCMACDEKGGDVLQFHMDLHGMDFVEAAKALGSWEDSPHSPRYELKPLPFRPRDALEVLREEAVLTAVAAGNIANGVQLTDEDRQRLLQAAQRVQFIVEAIA